MRRVKERLAGILDRGLQGRTARVLVVSGFPRSGTTWFQQLAAEALRAKTQHEPLSIHSGTTWPLLPPSTPRGQRLAYLPLGIDDLGADARAAVELAYHGACATKEGLKARGRLRHCLRTDVVVKFVRLGMALPEFLERHPAPCVHLRRHPVAVWASVVHTEHIRRKMLAAIDGLYRVERADAREEADRRELLRYVDPERPERGFAALWALSERRAQVAVDRGLAVDAVYEQVALNPAGVGRLLGRLGLDHDASKLVQKADSPTTTAKRRQVPLADRLTSWREAVAPEVQQSVLQVVGELCPGVVRHW